MKGGLSEIAVRNRSAVKGEILQAILKDSVLTTQTLLLASGLFQEVIQYVTP
ncbi:MAG TPA: hypothetical protein PKD37_07950 [Oligoflexia bacterium]|nr:hypothetical protein [Oligoflexia bacterium]HMP27895.1 hypothetical protein [Oligoflexia bacterium]